MFRGLQTAQDRSSLCILGTQSRYCLYTWAIGARTVCLHKHSLHALDALLSELGLLCIPEGLST